jgi:peptidoglycan/xylan/chitin deacetylase (PgdA/CDA1 family)
MAFNALGLHTRLLTGVDWGAQMTPSRSEIPRGSVLFYHGVIPELIDAPLQKNHITVAEFRRQLEWLRRHRVPVSADQVRAALAGESTLPRGWVLFTFDDGYKNNLEVVASEMGETPWMVYLATEMIDEGGRMPSYRVRRTLRLIEGRSIDLSTLGARFDCRTTESRRAVERALINRLKRLPRSLHDRLVEEVEAHTTSERMEEWDARFMSEAPMTWDDVRELANAKVSIGGHTHRHTLLHANQDPLQVQEEISLCASRIEAELGAPPVDFCWPNGRPQDLSQEGIRALARSSFEWATTTSVGTTNLRWSDRWLIPRIPAVRLETMIRWMTIRTLSPLDPPRPLG